MKSIINIKQEVIDFYERNGSIALEPDGRYMFMPFWIKENNDGTLELIEHKDLSDEFKDNLLKSQIIMKCPERYNIKIQLPDER